MAGVQYLLEASTSGFGQLLVPGMLVVSGDAAATATNIVGNEPLFRLGVAAALVAVAFHVAQTVLFYDLFKPVGHDAIRSLPLGVLGHPDGDRIAPRSRPLNRYLDVRVGRQPVRHRECHTFAIGLADRVEFTDHDTDRLGPRLSPRR